MFIVFYIIYVRAIFTQLVQYLYKLHNLYELHKSDDIHASYIKLIEIIQFTNELTQ